MTTIISTSFYILLVFFIYLSLFCSASMKIGHKKYRRSPQMVAISGLYNTSDQVEELTANSFPKKIYGSESAWLVEFYNTYCGHCQRYAPIYKAVADFFKGSKDIFVVAAVDCANDSNQPLCRYFDIMGYPTLRYFHENFIEGPENLGINVNKAHDNVNDNIKMVIELLQNEQKQNRAHMLPNLLPYEHNNISKIFDNVQAKVMFAFLVLENAESFMGIDAALTFHKVPNIYITSSPSSNMQLVNSLGLNELFPALIIVNRDSGELKIEGKYSKIESARKLIEAFLKKQGVDVNQYILNLDKKEIKSVIAPKDQKERDQIELRNRVKSMGDVVFQMDLESTLRFSLRQEVGRSKMIEGEKLKALRAYIKVLLKYFPLGRKGHFFLNNLNSVVTDSSSIKGADISSLVKNSEKEGQLIWSSPKEWLGCKGSTPGNRGYPCGLWTMFHYLTVNAAEQNIGRSVDPKEVLNAMYGYVKFFFGCADCSMHFQKMAAERHITGVSSVNEAVMWLWSAHNEVNDRLAGDPTEDPEFPKRQFPLVERCPECRFHNGSWNEKQVEKYLKHMYANINIRYIGSDTRVFHIDQEESNGVLNSIDSRNNSQAAKKEQSVDFLISKPRVNYVNVGTKTSIKGDSRNL